MGEFKNAGRVWRPRGTPQPVRVHDFLDPKKGKAIPYGVSDLALNRGWVSVGVHHDTAAFAVQTIQQWWRRLGVKAYRRAASLLIAADSGGSNGSRVRVWKRELQRLADATGLTVHVSHLPPGTSMWNKIEHRLFSFISQNWRGQPLLTYATIVQLIANTRTSTGLKVHCILDKRRYPKEVKVADEQMATTRLQPDPFHGNWNYTIRPHGREPPAGDLSLECIDVWIVRSVVWSGDHRIRQADLELQRMGSLAFQPEPNHLLASLRLRGQER